MFGGALARRKVYKNGGDSDNIIIKTNNLDEQNVKTQQSESKSQLLYIHPPIHKDDAEFFLYSEDGNQNRDDDTYDMNQQQATVTARFKELLVHHDDKLKSSQAMTKLLGASDNDSETLKLDSMEQQTKVVQVQPVLGQLAASSESSKKQSDSSNLINKQVYQRLSDKTQQSDDDDHDKLKSTKSNDSNSLGTNLGSGVEQKQDADKKLNKDNTVNTNSDKSNSNLNSDSESKRTTSNSPSPGSTAPTKNNGKNNNSSSKTSTSYQSMFSMIMWVFRFIIIITCICIGIAHCTKLGRGGTEEEDEPVASPENIDEDEEEISADHFSESVEEIKEGEGLIQDQNQSRM